MGGFNRYIEPRRSGVRACQLSLGGKHPAGQIRRQIQIQRLTSAPDGAAQGHGRIGTGQRFNAQVEGAGQGGKAAMFQLELQIRFRLIRLG